MLSSLKFDTATLELSVQQVHRGRVSPLFFYQVLPTAVLGQIAIDYRLTGPVSALATTGDPRAEALAVAHLTLAEGDADWVIALAAGLSADPADSFASADLVSLPAAPDDPAEGPV